MLLLLLLLFSLLVFVARGGVLRLVRPVHGSTLRVSTLDEAQRLEWAVDCDDSCPVCLHLDSLCGGDRGGSSARVGARRAAGAGVSISLGCVEGPSGSVVLPEGLSYGTHSLEAWRRGDEDAADRVLFHVAPRRRGDMWGARRSFAWMGAALVSVQARDFGLAHRLRNIAGAHAIARHLGRPLHVNWLPSAGCPASWGELFRGSPADLGLGEPLDLTALRDGPNGPAVFFGDLADVRSVERVAANRTVVIDAGFGDMRPPGMPCDRFLDAKADLYRALLRNLHPAVHRHLSTYPPQLTSWLRGGRSATGAAASVLVGVHVRAHNDKHDVANVPSPSFIPATFDAAAPLDAFVSMLRSVQARVPSARFFVTSNRRKYRDALQALLGPRAVLRTTAMQDQDRSGNGSSIIGHIGLTDERSKLAGIRAALADWAILATATDLIIGTFWSGFSDEAAAVLGTPKIMVRLGKHAYDSHWAAPGCGSGGHASSNCPSLFNGDNSFPMGPCTWIERRWGIDSVMCTRRDGSKTPASQLSAAFQTIQPLHRLGRDMSGRRIVPATSAALTWTCRGEFLSARQRQELKRSSQHVLRTVSGLPRGCIAIGQGFSLAFDAPVAHVLQPRMLKGSVDDTISIDRSWSPVNAGGHSLIQDMRGDSPEQRWHLPPVEHANIVATNVIALTTALGAFCELRRLAEEACDGLRAAAGSGLVDADSWKAMVAAQRIELGISRHRQRTLLPLNITGTQGPLDILVAVDDDPSGLVRELEARHPFQVAGLSSEASNMLGDRVQDTHRDLVEVTFGTSMDTGLQAAAWERMLSGFAYYSSWGQDEWVIHGHEGSVFLEISGEVHSIGTPSSTAALESRGWRGACVTMPSNARGVQFARGSCRSSLPASLVTKSSLSQHLLITVPLHIDYVSLNVAPNTAGCPQGEGIRTFAQDSEATAAILHNLLVELTATFSFGAATLTVPSHAVHRYLSAMKSAGLSVTKRWTTCPGAALSEIWMR